MIDSVLDSDWPTLSIVIIGVTIVGRTTGKFFPIILLKFGKILSVVSSPRRFFEASDRSRVWLLADPGLFRYSDHGHSQQLSLVSASCV